MDTLKRFDRLIALLVQLQSKRVVRAQELAERFGVSLRTIYRDIRSLETAGVPLYGEAGVGYSLVEGYRLPPVMFTREEAASFVTAEKLMQKFTDKTLSGHHASAMYKIKSVLRGAEKDWISAVEGQVWVDTSDELFNTAAPDALEILLESIAEKQQVQLHYQAQNTDHPTERTVEPVGLFHENQHWHLHAYCRLRGDYRQFRTDRIHKIARNGQTFSRQHPPLSEFLQPERCENSVRVRISVDKAVVKYIRSGRKYYGFVSEEDKGDQVEMTFLSPNPDQGFARWYMMFGDCARILEPESLQERVQNLARETLKGLS